LITPILFGDKYRSVSSSLCSLPHAIPYKHALKFVNFEKFKTPFHRKPNLSRRSRRIQKYRIKTVRHVQGLTSELRYYVSMAGNPTFSRYAATRLIIQCFLPWKIRFQYNTLHHV
jgi:hypothetical protein